MKGTYEITVKNRRLQYRFEIKRNITILKGDSATGKTTLIDMIYAYQQNGDKSGVSITCERPCVVLTGQNWNITLEQVHNSIVFIDEGDTFVKTKDFSSLAKKSDNYYVIATRNGLSNLPYSISEIYGIKNISGNKYQNTKRLYSQFYPIYNKDEIIKPDLIIVEDSNSGFEFFSYICKLYNISCISANGKSNVAKIITQSNSNNILVIADGAAFGSEIEKVFLLSSIKKNIGFYFPESFEWIILMSGVLKDKNVQKILEQPSDFIDCKKYFSWEQFFTSFLMEKTKGTYFQYSKSKLPSKYYDKNVREQIISVIPKGILKK